MLIKANVVRLLDVATLKGNIVFSHEYPSLPNKGDYIYHHDTSSSIESVYRVVAVVHRISGKTSSPTDIFVTQIDKMQLRDAVYADSLDVAEQVQEGVQKALQELGLAT